MKRTFLSFLSILFFLPALAQTTEEVPKYITLQAVLTDDGGSVISEQIQEADFTFRIVDGAETVLFEEEQTHVPVVRGAISVLVGAGTEGGINIDALNPEGDHLLQIQMGGQNIPQENLQLVSVPS